AHKQGNAKGSSPARPSSQIRDEVKLSQRGIVRVLLENSLLISHEGGRPLGELGIYPLGVRSMEQVCIGSHGQEFLFGLASDHALHEQDLLEILDGAQTDNGLFGHELRYPFCSILAKSSGHDEPFLIGVEATFSPIATKTARH